MTMIRSISFVLIVLLTLGQSVPASDQHTAEECGFVMTPEQMQKARDRAESNNYFQGAFREVDSIYQIPIIFHLIRRSDGTSPSGSCPDNFGDNNDMELSLSDQYVVFNDLNQRFELANIEFKQIGRYYIDNDSLYCAYYHGLGAYVLGRDYAVNYPEAINIFFSPYTGSFGEAAYVPNSKAILVRNTSATNGSTVAHEIGHYLGLMHTHQLWPDGSGGYLYECPDGSNCTTTGDLFCDTPADPNLLSKVTSGCVFTGADTPANCDPTAYNPATDNLMSYSLPDCRVNFTGQQVGEMRYTLRNERPELDVKVVWPCCEGITGNIDGINEIDIADIMALVSFYFILPHPEPPCLDEINVDGSSGPGNDWTIADLTYLVAYLFKGGPEPVPCPPVE